MRHAGDSLFAEVDAVGAVVSNVAGLIEGLGGLHGGASGKAELAAGFDLHGGGSKRRTRTASARIDFDICDGEFGVSERF